MISPLVLLIGAGLFCVTYFFSLLFKPGLKDIPGPWFAKISNLYRVGMVLRGRFSYELVELHKKYGPAVRTGPDSVSLTDRRLVDDIYGLRTDFGKSDWVKSSQTLFQGKIVPALMTTQDKEYHTTLKKSIASAYSVTTLMGYETSVEDTVQYFLKRLDELFIQTGDKCPIHQWLQWYAYDVIGAVTMSKPMGLLEQGRDVDNMLGEIQAEGDYRAVGAVMPFIDWVYRKNPLMAFLSPARTHTIMVTAKGMLDERLASMKEPSPTSSDSESDSESNTPRDFISRFLQAKAKNPGTLNDRNMMGFVGSNLQAGSDTTAIALRTIMYYVMKNPHILAKMREELDGAGETYPIPFQKAFNNLPYTSAVIYEALRIHPPFALLLERCVPASGLELPDGTVLPQGTKVGMFGYTMHLDKEIYGEDAEEFRPERWLQGEGEDEEEFKDRLRGMKGLDMAFGIGQRRCAGVHVAELQIWKVVPVLVGLLDMELVNPGKEWTVTQRFFSLQSDMDVKIRWREGRSLKDLKESSSSI